MNRLHFEIEVDTQRVRGRLFVHPRDEIVRGNREGGIDEIEEESKDASRNSGGSIFVGQ